jgi:hypothetical protein
MHECGRDPFTDILDSLATGLVRAIEVSLGADLSIDITGDFIPNNWDFDIWVSVHAHPILLILSLS